MFNNQADFPFSFTIYFANNSKMFILGGPSGLARLTGYGSDSAEEGDQGNSAGSASASNLDEQQLTDWSKLACLLCKRQFPSREKLTK